MINLRDFKTIKERRRILEKELNISLPNIGHYSLDENLASNRNCENMIGVTQIPLGVAGPIRINDNYRHAEFSSASPPGEIPEINSGQVLKQAMPAGRQVQNDNKNYFVPLSTTEGALVASVNRGCKAIRESGGVNVYVEKVGITRGPVFKTKSLVESFELSSWLSNNLNYLNSLCKQTSGHLTLFKIEPQVLGKQVFVRLYFDTDEAMGMNMITIASSLIVEIIEQKTGAKCISVSGNFCVDKKPSWLNFLLGRGRKVWAEATIPKEIIKKVLKTTPQKIYDVWLNKCLLGSTMSGSMGCNSHFANIIAAIFTACGQDLAHVTEGSLGITTAEIIKEDFYSSSDRRESRSSKRSSRLRSNNNLLYISVYLPDLPIGVVGGGTNLATQKEALSIIFGKENPSVDEFACVLGGAVLAGELSLLASLAEGSLACSHQKLGRGKLRLNDH